MYGENILSLTQMLMYEYSRSNFLSKSGPSLKSASRMQSNHLWRDLPRSAFCTFALNPLHEKLYMSIGLLPVGGVTTSRESCIPFVCWAFTSGNMATCPALNLSASYFLMKYFYFIAKLWAPYMTHLSISL